MANEADRILHEHADRLLIAGNYSVKLVVSKAVRPILKLDNLKQTDIPHVLPFVLDGMRYRARAYKGAGYSDDETVSQSDFTDISTDFARLIYAPVALDEAPGTRRMRPYEMTLPELKQHIALKEQKANQTQANAELFQRFLERHPDWEDRPDLTLGQVLAEYGDEREVA